MRLPALLLLAALLLPTPVAANDRLSAAELMQMCSSTHDVDYGYCAGYITAIADQMLSTGTAGGERACNHAGVRSQQYVDVFRSFRGNLSRAIAGSGRTHRCGVLCPSFSLPLNLAIGSENILGLAAGIRHAQERVLLRAAQLQPHHNTVAARLVLHDHDRRFIFPG